MFGSIFTSPDYIRQMQQAQHQAEMIARLNRMNAQPPRKPTSARADVIDLVPTADGAYAVPAALEHRVRTAD
ncbi:hypothetical protein C0214_19595 [Methylobacterium sp. DM1]|nr:hypothetical protein C0214_19595 [Methylobacterium sp. DM1]